jgi:thiol-disulfide isomerase/thioredoxin
MKTKQLIFFLFWIPFFSYAQYTIKGTIAPFDKDIKWAMLYQIKEGRQHYVKNTKIVNQQFSFEIPETSATGMYRVVYRLKEEGFLDFLFNKEDVSFTFHPDYAEGTVVFETSRENKIYQSYLQNISGAQQYIDSLQVAYFKKATPVSEDLYREAYYELKDIQKEFESASKNRLAFHFIKATQRYNAPKIVHEPKVYLENSKTYFFKHISFKDSVLIQSSFLVDRVIDYVFHLNYSKDPKIQEALYKESIKNVVAIPKEESLQKDLIEILINEFVKYEDIELVSFLFETYYDTLSSEIQNKEYKLETLAKMQMVVGRIAPDFSWGEHKKLSEIATHTYYIIVFWSTGCSHCKAQLPEMYAYLKSRKKIQVIAVALEKNDIDWKELIPQFEGWEHVLGMGKWLNTIARSYNVESTPTYVLLNANKRIIALPDNYKELKEAVALIK